jgi:hypothetical protein
MMVKLISTIRACAVKVELGTGMAVVGIEVVTGTGAVEVEPRTGIDVVVEVEAATGTGAVKVEPRTGRDIVVEVEAAGTGAVKVELRIGRDVVVEVEAATKVSEGGASDAVLLLLARGLSVWALCELVSRTRFILTDSFFLSSTFDIRWVKSLSVPITLEDFDTAGDAEEADALVADALKHSVAMMSLREYDLEEPMASGEPKTFSTGLGSSLISNRFLYPPCTVRFAPR